jgi:hypothetical protein
MAEFHPTHLQRMEAAEFMQIAEKTMSENVNQKGKMVHISKPILPTRDEMGCYHPEAKTCRVSRTYGRS